MYDTGKPSQNLNLICLLNLQAETSNSSSNRKNRTAGSMRTAVADLTLKHLYAVYSESKAFPL
ncbi:hypothetical protein CSA37_09665 [Candidatus Fermentibacteria bacterium]|nr:MAG: hypothetical protein CSA37_09665 [Candidatus Fermentibacteria bacterium]